MAQTIPYWHVDAFAASPFGGNQAAVMVLEEWLRRIYSEAYSQGLDDPRLARMIDPLPDGVPLIVL